MAESSPPDRRAIVVKSFMSAFCCLSSHEEESASTLESVKSRYSCPVSCLSGSLIRGPHSSFGYECSLQARSWTTSSVIQIFEPSAEVCRPDLPHKGNRLVNLIDGGHNGHARRQHVAPFPVGTDHAYGSLSTK